MQVKPLTGVKIADFCWAAAGPITTGYLAQAGATVIKVETATRPDAQRTFPPNKDRKAGPDRSFMFNIVNAGKLSMTINLNNPKGLDVAKKLVAWADVVTENYRPGTMERWGLGYEDLKKINPSIIMFRSSAQGQTGPDSDMGATGITLQSLTGFTFLTGWPDRQPAPPWGAYTDLTVTALSAAVLAGAIDYRARTGKGQYLDLSQFEASLHFLAPAVLDYSANGRSASRAGNASDYAVPHGIFRCVGEDSWCAIAVETDEEWRNFCKALQKTEWIKDPRFSTLLARKEHEAELEALIEEWTSIRTAEDVMELLQSHSVPAGVAGNAADVLNDPQMKARGFFRELTHPEIGTFSHQNPSFKLSKTPCNLDRTGPIMGQHTEYVCREFLGISDDEFVALLSEGALE